MACSSAAFSRGEVHFPHSASLRLELAIQYLSRRINVSVAPPPITRAITSVSYEYFSSSDRQLFAAGRRDLVGARPPIVGRYAPDTLDPAVWLQPLNSGVRRALLDEELVVGRLLNELDYAVSMEMIAQRQRPLVNMSSEPAEIVFCA